MVTGAYGACEGGGPSEGCSAPGGDVCINPNTHLLFLCSTCLAVLLRCCVCAAEITGGLFTASQSERVKPCLTSVCVCVCVLPSHTQHIQTCSVALFTLSLCPTNTHRYRQIPHTNSLAILTSNSSSIHVSLGLSFAHTHSHTLFSLSAADCGQLILEREAVV